MNTFCLLFVVVFSSFLVAVVTQQLPKDRQTMLFSATQTKKVEDLVRVSFKGKPVFVGVSQDDVVSTVARLEQGYVVCPSQQRFLLLFTFLKRNLKKKVMVRFFSIFFYLLLLLLLLKGDSVFQLKMS